MLVQTLCFAAASSDGSVSVHSWRGPAEHEWDVSLITGAHRIGCNAVSWAPAASTVSGSTGVDANAGRRRLVTGGCDNLVKVWEASDNGRWTCAHELKMHGDWVGRCCVFSIAC